jgi:hypothetical protein
VLAELALASIAFAVFFLVVMRLISGEPASILMLSGYLLALLIAIPFSGLAFRRRLLALQQS